MGRTTNPKQIAADNQVYILGTRSYFCYCCS